MGHHTTLHYTTELQSYRATEIQSYRATEPHLLITTRHSKMSAKLTQKVVDQWLEAAWRDGFTKGQDGTDDIPDFATLDPRGPSDTKPKMDAAELSHAPFDMERCSARMYRQGHGVQCTRKHLPDCDGLCKTHFNKFSILPDGMDIRFGRYNAERPINWLDVTDGDKIGWKDLRSKSPEKKPRVPAKEMRDKLTQLGISVEGLKGKILSEKYREAIHQHEIDTQVEDVVSDLVSSVEQSETDTEVNVEEVLEEVVEVNVEEAVAEVVSDLVSSVEQSETDTEVNVEEPVEEVVEEPVEEEEEVVEETEEQVVTPVPKMSEESEEEMVEMLEETSEQQSDTIDDGSGTGLSPKKGPSSVTEYKKLFKELNISMEGLKGARGFKDAYAKYLSDSSADTEDLSDEELDEDDKVFVEIDYEGVDYLEDENSGNIYSLDHTVVGRWDGDCSEIIWENDGARMNHESKKD